MSFQHKMDFTKTMTGSQNGCDENLRSPSKSDRAESEESNDMTLNYPDIELMEQKRGLTKEQKLALRLKRLEEKRIAEEEATKTRKENAMKSMKYLLTVSEKYSDFFKKNTDETQR